MSRITEICCSNTAHYTVQYVCIVIFESFSALKIMKRSRLGTTQSVAVRHTTQTTYYRQTRHHVVCSCLSCSFNISLTGNEDRQHRSSLSFTGRAIVGQMWGCEIFSPNSLVTDMRTPSTQLRRVPTAARHVRCNALKGCKGCWRTTFGH